MALPTRILVSLTLAVLCLACIVPTALATPIRAQDILLSTPNALGQVTVTASFDLSGHPRPSDSATFHYSLELSDPISYGEALMFSADMPWPFLVLIPDEGDPPIYADTRYLHHLGFPIEVAWNYYTNNPLTFTLAPLLRVSGGSAVPYHPGYEFSNTVTISSLDVWIEHPPSGGESVPDPGSSLLLLGTALAGLAACARLWRQ